MSPPAWTQHARLSSAPGRDQPGSRASCRRPAACGSLCCRSGRDWGMPSAARPGRPRRRFLPLIKGTNAAGAAQAGLSAPSPCTATLLYVLAGDDDAHGRDLPAGCLHRRPGSLSDGMDRARPTLCCRPRCGRRSSGHIVNVEGHELPVVPFVKAPKGIPADDVAFGMLAIQMGKRQAPRRAPLRPSRRHDSMPRRDEAGSMPARRADRWPRRSRWHQDWLAGCAGCHMSLLDIDERIVNTASRRPT